jgi:hypothetical protein
MATLEKTLDHLLTNVLEAASDYWAAEEALSLAQHAGDWAKEAKTAKRKAAELAIAIDGLSDRASREAHIPVDEVRVAVSALCFWAGSLDVRRLAFESVHGVANAYKHLSLDKISHVIASFDDALAVGLG